MVFSSNIFLLYFMPIFFLVYFILPKKMRNYFLLFASLVFYAWGAPEFIIQLFVSTIANFYLVRWMCKTDKPGLKKVLCGISVAISIGLLFYFKYGNFTMQNLNAILGWMGCQNVTWTKILLPIGISFFSFQSVTYTLDTYRDVNKPMERLSDYMLYITMFPQLIAGPIIRYCDIADQIRNRDSLYTDRLHGFYRFVIGLCKKVLIADVIGFQVDQILGPSNYDVLTSAQLADIASKIATIDSTSAWIAIFAFTFQIYFDFAGYSDMAIGLGKMMGFRFPENFMNPYTSRSITEFWRRWHITLGTFMKEYLYIPLGGNRRGSGRTYLNLIIVFLCSGFWHGASWNFVIWGAYHGLFQIFERLGMAKVLDKMGKLPSVLLTFLIVNLGWVLFRADNLSQAFGFYKALFAFSSGSMLTLTPRFWFIFALALLFSFITLLKKGQALQDKIFADSYSAKLSWIMFVLVAVLFVLSVGSLLVTDFNPFIYFRF